MTGKDDLIPAAGYIRVSTDEQAEGFSLGAQEERLEAYARSQGYELIAIYRDDGYSAKDFNATGLGRWMRVLVRKVKVSDKFNTHLSTPFHKYCYALFVGDRDSSPSFHSGSE